MATSSSVPHLSHSMASSVIEAVSLGGGEWREEEGKREEIRKRKGKKTRGAEKEGSKEEEKHWGKGGRKKERWRERRENGKQRGRVMKKDREEERRGGKEGVGEGNGEVNRRGINRDQNSIPETYYFTCTGGGGTETRGRLCAYCHGCGRRGGRV